jgi:E3 ubiquitin-protein ligase UBR7
MPLYDSLPYLLCEEVVYEPPVDPDSQKTLEELGTDALSKLPHEQAIHGLEAYTSMRDKLKMFLEPFAKEGKVVSKEDVERFFEEQKQKLE